MNNYDNRKIYRPQFHFAPEKNWMNDPNGMVYYAGEYHLFYQYHPFGTTWGPMHWGHAVSKDLIHWEHLPIALYPDDNGYIFSGSAVVDWKDTSGFFNEGAGLVAIFTQADHDPHTDRQRQRQSLAYSMDCGRTWTMYAGNPVLAEEEITDFRDPKVFWHESSGYWIMIVAAGDRVRIYRSSNLKQWFFASEFGKDQGSHAGVWECPDLFELPVEGDSDRTKWVMIVSIGIEEEVAEGSRTQYFIGEFDGFKFVNDNDPSTVLWLDCGRDNYAGVTWSDIPKKDGRRIFMGWMSNWKYANETPTEGWRSAMTIPRVLTLRDETEGIRLFQNPAAELQHLRLENIILESCIITPDHCLLTNISGERLEIVAEIVLQNATEFGFKIHTSEHEETIIGYDTDTEHLFVDRTKSGCVDFNEYFPCMHSAYLPASQRRVKLHIFVDRSSVEIFANDGKVVITDLIFPSETSNGIQLYAKEGNVKLENISIYQLKSISSIKAEVEAKYENQFK